MLFLVANCRAPPPRALPQTACAGRLAAFVLLEASNSCVVSAQVLFWGKRASGTGDLNSALLFLALLSRLLLVSLPARLFWHGLLHCGYNNTISIYLHVAIMFS